MGGVKKSHIPDASWVNFKHLVVSSGKGIPQSTSFLNDLLQVSRSVLSA